MMAINKRNSNSNNNGNNNNENDNYNNNSNSSNKSDKYNNNDNLRDKLKSLIFSPVDKHVYQNDILPTNRHSCLQCSTYKCRLKFAECYDSHLLN